jgi:hypothetical protein
MQRKKRLQLWLLLSLFGAGITGLYWHRVLGPWEHYIDVETGRSKASMGDLYPRWVGTRALLLEGKNPYGPEVSHEIQMAFYGHEIHQTYDQPEKDRIDEQRFAYPVYVVFLLAPTVHIDFAVLQSWTPVVLAMLTAASMLLWLEVLHWRPPWPIVCAMILFMISSPQIAQGLRLRQFGLLVAFLIALSAWCVMRNHLATAGLLLALATIKPQMVALPLACFLTWSVGDVKKRWRLAAGFAGALALLAGAGELLLPRWPRYFLEGIVAYRKYFPTTSPLRLALGNGIGEAVGGVIIIGLLIFAWRNRAQPGDSPQFASTLAASFIAATLALPILTPFNQAMLILPVLMVLGGWASLPKFSRVTFILITSWPWIVELVLLLFPPRLNSLGRFPLLPSLLVLSVPFLVPLWLVTRKANVQAGQSLIPQ